MVRVLYVDDNEDDLFLTERACNRYGAPFEFVQARSVAEAISSLKSAQTRGAGLPKLIFLELLTQRRKGFEVLGFLRSDAQLSQIPVVVFTGSCDPALHSKAEALGANYIVEKEPGLQIASKLLAVARELGLYSPSRASQRARGPELTAAA